MCYANNSPPSGIKAVIKGTFLVKSISRGITVESLTKTHTITLKESKINYMLSWSKINGNVFQPFIACSSLSYRLIRREISAACVMLIISL